MTALVEAALRVLRVVAERPDPTVSTGSGEIAGVLGWSPSRASRACAELTSLGLLSEGDRYGSYRLGASAVRLSGAAAAAVALPVRYALTLASQVTGETACLAAPTGDSLHIVATVGSEWTLHAAADVGEEIRAGTAVALAAAPGATGGTPTGLLESTDRRVVEVATPILGADGDVVAVVAIRLPENRAVGGVPRARRAVEAARRRIEGMVDGGDPGRRGLQRGDRLLAEVAAPPEGERALAATVRILAHLARGADTVPGIALATTLRADRVHRLLDAAVRAGIAVRTADGLAGLGWGVHGWHRAATGPLLTSAGREIVARTAAEAGVYGFITVLRGIRSFTVVEELGEPDGGIAMMSWLGRPHPVIGSDGGPTLVMEFASSDLSGLLGKRHAAGDLDLLVRRIETVSRDGVISIDSDQDAGLVSLSAPVRDASGMVAAAACLTGATDSVAPRRPQLEDATRDLAARLTALVS